MAMKKCHECGKDISSRAGRCPHCGARHDYGPLGWVLAAVILLAILVKCIWP